MPTLPAGFIAPYLPTKSSEPPGGADWLHEIKHDGIRVIARKQDGRVRFYSRPGNDLTKRFPFIVEALAHARVSWTARPSHAARMASPRSSASTTGHHDATVFMWAFDMVELDGDDMRREPVENRKATLASLLRRASAGVRLNEHLEHEDGQLVFAYACRMGLEGIVSKRKGSAYRSGRTADWLKAKNPSAPAVTRLAEEDWNRR
jgi:ATP-dependent DNA ligase